MKSFLSFPKRLFALCKGTFAKAISLIVNTKIQLRLTVLFIILSVIPLAITGFFSYRESVDAITSKTSTYSAQVMSQIAVNIKTELDRLENDSVDISLSELTQNALINIDNLSEREIYNIESTLKDILVKKFSILHDVSDVQLYSNSGKRIIAYGDRSFKLNFKKEFLDEYLKQLVENKGTPVWKGANHDAEGILVRFATSPEQMNKSDCILLGRAILALDTREVIGTLIIRTNERYFSNIYRNTNMGTDADIFVIDSEGNVVSSRNPQIPVAQKFREPRLINELLARGENDSKTFRFEIGDKSYLIAYAPIQSAGWFVVSTIPYSYINSEAREIRSTILLLGLACSILAVFLSYIFTLTISRPLKRLVSAMNEVKKGNLSIGALEKRNDEIGEVTDNFSKMLSEIKKLMEDVKKQEMQKRKAEIETLQAQINPHFLSNTLNTVKWLASAQKADNIETIVSSLIQLLSVSMGKGGEFITVRQEIEYIKSYINIQEYRYYDKFKVVFDIEDEILDYRILKFLVQPIVENSIIHGTKTKTEQELIVIKGFRYDKVLKIIVTDNGVGIPGDKLSKLITGDREDRKNTFSGIGINNVHERIQMYFGPSYGLQIESVPNLYTTVELSVPIITQGDMML